MGIHIDDMFKYPIKANPEQVHKTAVKPAK